MKREERKRVLVIIGDLNLDFLYTSILKHEHYSLRLHSYHEEELLKVVLDFDPQLIILHIEPEFYEAALELLSKVHQAYRENKHPRHLCVLSRSWRPKSIITLVDAFVASPFDPKEFLQTIEELLQESSV